MESPYKGEQNLGIILYFRTRVKRVIDHDYDEPKSKIQFTGHSRSTVIFSCIRAAKSLEFIGIKSAILTSYIKKDDGNLNYGRPTSYSED